MPFSDPRTSPYFDFRSEATSRSFDRITAPKSLDHPSSSRIPSKARFASRRTDLQRQAGDEPVDRVADGIGTAWIHHLRHDGIECFEVFRGKRNGDHDHGDSKLRLTFIRDRATANAHDFLRSRSGPI